MARWRILALALSLTAGCGATAAMAQPYYPPGPPPGRPPGPPPWRHDRWHDGWRRPYYGGGYYPAPAPYAPPPVVYAPPPPPGLNLFFNLR